MKNARESFLNDIYYHGWRRSGEFSFLRRPETGLKTFGGQRDSFCCLSEMGKLTSCRIPTGDYFYNKASGFNEKRILT